VNNERIRMNQVAEIDRAEANALIAELGGGTQEETITVPFLKINYDQEDKQGRDVKRGTIYLEGQSEAVYAPKVNIHVMAQYYQYRQSDPSTYKIVNKTVLMEDMRRGEPRDMLGGIRCGRPASKTMAELSQEDQDMWRKKVKATRILRGVCSYEGITADGDAKSVVNEPFQLYITGSSFLEFDKVLNSLPYGKRYQDFWVEFSTEKKDKYFLSKFKTDFQKPADLTKDVVETMKLFVAMAKQENGRIEAGYRSASIEGTVESKAYDAISGDLDQDLA